MFKMSEGVPACLGRERSGRLAALASCAGAALLSTFLWASPASAAADSVGLPNSAPYPESVTSTADGTLYLSSLTDGGVVRAKPGAATAEEFIKPGAYDTRSTLGVYADEKNGLLWVASDDVSALGLKGPSSVEGAWIKAFDLKTGEGKMSVRLPSSPALVNDFVLGQDGNIYVTDTLGASIYRLKPGAKEVELVVHDDRMKGGPDGLDFGSDGALYVNTYGTGQLFRVDLQNGTGKVTELKLSRPVVHADAMRAYKGGFLMIEGFGGDKLDRITVNGDEAKVDTVASFAGPTGVTIVGDKAWVSEGQLAYLNKQGNKPESFQVRSVSLSKE